MSEIIEMINKNQAVFSLAFSFIVMLSTVIYALLTWKLTKETMKMRKAQTEPKIVFFFEPSHVGIHFLDLVIKNVGLGVAYNVTFRILEEFPVRDGKKLSDIDFIREGINYMPPDYSIRSYMLNFLESYKNVIDKKIKVEIKCQNLEGIQISEIITLNMSQFKGIQSLGEDPMAKIAKNIESMSKEIGNLASGFHHLAVDTYTSADREKKAAEYEKQREEYRKQSLQNEANSEKA